MGKKLTELTNVTTSGVGPNTKAYLVDSDRTANDQSVGYDFDSPTGTGSTITMNKFGGYFNIATPSTATTFTLDGDTTSVNAYVVTRTQGAATQPVTSPVSTQEGGVAWNNSDEFEMIVWRDAEGLKHKFTATAVGAGGGGGSDSAGYTTRFIVTDATYGAKGDAVQYTDGAITATDATFTSASNPFVSGDVGKVIHIEGAGTSGGYHTTTISGFTSAGEVELTDVGVTTVSGATFIFGTDDTTAIQSAINAAFSAKGGTVFIPHGVYILNGALQNNIGAELIDYNSQLYIPYIADATLSTQNTNSKAIINIEGEVAPMPVQGSGLSTYPLLATLKATVLLSTIQGSGVKPSVICSTGDTGTFPDNFNWISTKIQNIEILLTPNANDKITIGGLNFFESITSFFEHVTIFPYNINLFDLEQPDVINVDGISYNKLNCSKGGYIKTCLVAGVTNGFRIGEHGEVYGGFASVCENGFLQESSNHTSNYYRVKADWCINAFNINDDCAIHVFNFDGEYRSTGDWYDTSTHVLDASNMATGVFHYNIIEASVGLNNSLFTKTGGGKVRDLPISFDAVSDITVSGTTTDEKLTSLLEALERQGHIIYNPVPLANLIRYYRFDDDVTDETGNGNGTATSITYVTGKSNKAADFAGGTNYVTIPDAADLSFGNATTDSACSFSFFVNVDNFDGELGNDFILSKRDGSPATDREYQIYFENDKLTVLFWDHSAGANIGAQVNTATSTGTWVHYTVTYSGSGTYAGITVYENGATVATTDVSSGSYTAMEAGTQVVNIGTQNWNLGNSSLNGKIDGLGIWDAELTALEASNVFATQNGGGEVL